MLIKTYLAVALAGALALSSGSALSMEIRKGTPIEVGADADDDDANTQVLNGSFVSLSPSRKLTTSVGEFQLNSSTAVIDRRTEAGVSAKVSITYRNRIISQVIIFH